MHRAGVLVFALCPHPPAPRRRVFSTLPRARAAHWPRTPWGLTRPACARPNVSGSNLEHLREWTYECVAGQNANEARGTHLGPLPGMESAMKARTDMPARVVPRVCGREESVGYCVTARARPGVPVPSSREVDAAARETLCSRNRSDSYRTGSCEQNRQHTSTYIQRRIGRASVRHGATRGRAGTRTLLLLPLSFEEMPESDRMFSPAPR